MKAPIDLTDALAGATPAEATSAFLAWLANQPGVYESGRGGVDAYSFLNSDGTLLQNVTVDETDTDDLF